MKLRKIFRISIVVLILVVGTLLLLSLYRPGLSLVLRDQQTGKVLASAAVEEGMQVTFSWIHSAEFIPWIEEYTILDGSFHLKTIQVAGFGAGIPENKGTTSLRDGMVVMEELDQVFPEIRWIHSQTALTKITLENRIFITGENVPHHIPVELHIEGVGTIWPRFRLTK
ncbi:MAG: DUF1850 domain-containing protein [Sphaerochaeta sp.]